MQIEQKAGNFVQKLQKLLKSETYADIITWDLSKTSIDVLDIRRMEAEIIPKYFRHQKFESFVRQLNLYGFRKIKLHGRHRFTHPLLLNGQKLTAITSFKCMKNTKGSKQTVQSPFQQQHAPIQAQNNRILLNSIENAFEEQALNQRTQNLARVGSQGMQSLGGSAFFVIPTSYLNFWNYMQLMGAQNFPNMMPMAPLIPQQ